MPRMARMDRWLPRVEHIDYSKVPLPDCAPNECPLPPCGDITHHLSCMHHIGEQMAGVSRTTRDVLADASAYAELAYLHAELAILRSRALVLRLLGDCHG